MLAWVTLPGCFKQIRSRGFKPVMMGDLGPAKPGWCLVPHRAENSSIEGEGREQCLVYLGFTESTLAVPELPNW